MKKLLTQKLTVNKETLRNLSDRELADAVGGGSRFCSGTSSSCSYDTCVCPTLASNCC
ncbi:MAG: class I lanthipeptide [Thermoanaerobaculia bacterium]